MNFNDQTHTFKESLRYRGIYNRYIKRIVGLVLSLILLVVVIPISIIIAIAIVIETGFPIFYRAERGGYKGKSFKIYKFRSMIKDADKVGGGTTALNDSRITKVGSFLRKTKLDEIPQLINIIKGEMCFIGPRPELLKYTSQYKGIEKYILQVRPGITDYSSIEFINLDEVVGSENADEMYERHVLKTKNKLRIKYVNDISFKTDVKLFIKTIMHVFKKASSVVLNKKELEDGVY